MLNVYQRGHVLAVIQVMRMLCMMTVIPTVTVVKLVLMKIIIQRLYP